MLEVQNLSVIAKDHTVLLQDVSLVIRQGMAVGLTGQSGAGKTTLLRSVLGMLDGQYRISGEVRIDGVSLYEQTLRQRRNFCGTTLGFIPQNPMTAFDGRVKIGNQIAETLRLRAGLSGAQAKESAVPLLSELGLDDPQRVLDSYPGQLSGGMLQRVMVALLLALDPKYILADEPTSALDEENRGLLLERLAQRRDTSGILLISHDVEALRHLCETVHVMEQGRLTETGTMQQLLVRPERPWTRAFAAAARCSEQEEWIWTD